MKITFISDQFYPRTSADSEQIISSLSALNSIVDVTLLSANYSSKKPVNSDVLEQYYGMPSTFKLSFINHLFPNVRGIEKMVFAIRSALKIKKTDCELVYTRNIPVLIAVSLFTNLPLIFETYRPWPNQNIFSNYFFRKISTFDRLIGIVLHSNFAKKSFTEVGFEDQKLIVAHNAFNAFSNDEVDVNKIREKYNLPINKLIVTYSGRVNKQKGLHKMLNLAEKFSDICFLIVGSEGEGEIEIEARRFENVKVLGWLEKREVFSILQSSDILYIPTTLMAREISKNTVLPLKTFIYKASGRVIFGPMSDDVCEVLTHNETAYLVEPDNIEEEEKGFAKLIKDEELRDRLGNKAKEDMDGLTWEKRAEVIYKFIKSNS